MKSLDSFRTPQKSIDWATTAIDNAQAAFRAFLACDHTMPKIEQFDPATGHYETKIVQAADIPSEFESNVTNALNLLRNSFDQSLFAACVAISQSREKANYPWADNPDPDLERRLTARVSKGSDRLKIPDSLWDCIRRQQPYGRGEGYSGGDDVIREIAKVANAKHTVGFVVVADIAGVSHYFPTGEGGRWVALGDQTWNPLKKEIVLYVSNLPNLGAFQNYQKVAFRMTYPQGSPLAGLPVTDTLRVFANKAQSVLDTFKARAVELGAT